MKKKLLILLGTLIILIIGALVYVQSALNTAPDKTKSWILTKIENIISSPDMKISISNVEGALWGETHIREITIADRDGIWLKLDNINLDLNRFGLIGKNVNIARLHADTINLLRKPLSANEQKKTKEPSEGFSYPPQLPVAIDLKNLDVPVIRLGESIIGQSAELSAIGNLTFKSKALSTKIELKRLDAAGTVYADINLKETVGNNNITIHIQEPQNGIVANLAQFEGRPALDFNIKGQGSWTDLNADITLDADHARVLDGKIKLASQDKAVALNTSLKGPIARIMPSNIGPFLGEETTLDLIGALKKTSDGQIFFIDSLSVNAGAQLQAVGQYNLGNGAFDLKATADVADMAKLHDLAQGGLHTTLTARNQNNIINIDAKAEIDSAVISGRKLEDTTATLSTTINRPDASFMELAGQILVNGKFNHEILNLNANFSDDQTGRQLKELQLSLGNIKVAGNLRQSRNALINGALHIDAPDIESLTALALLQGKGTIKANIALADNGGKQEANIVARAQNVHIGNKGTALIDIESLDTNLVLHDLFGKLQADGNVNAKTIATAGYIIHQLQAKAITQGNDTNFDINANLQNNIAASLSGALTPLENKEWNAQFNTLNIKGQDVAVQANNPFALRLSQTGITVSSFYLNVNDGHIKADGVIADDLGIEINMQRLPLSLANLVKPELGLSGTLSGGININGHKTSPDLSFNFQGRDLSSALLREKNVPTINLDAQGSTKNNMLDFNADIAGGGLDINAAGHVPMGNGNLDVNVNLRNLPVTLANGFVANQNLGGAINGTAHITGNIQNPSASFSLTGQSLSAKTLADNGLAPLSLKGNGTFANNRLALENFSANGPQNLNINAHGALPLSGNGLDLKIDGSAPLGLANKILAERGAQATGTLNLNATVQGSITNPRLGGSFNVANGSFIDAESNLHLKGINVTGSLQGDRIAIDSIQAQSSAGGGLSASGYVSTDAAQNFPADIHVNLDHFRYADGKMVIATVNGQVSVSGALLHDPVIGGDITIEHAEITVPSTFGGASQFDVDHKNMTPPVATTLERARIDIAKNSAPVPTARPSVPQLKMRIRAPNQIFVRGRGLDVELGGNLGLVGPVTNIRPIGAFNMLRGRFDILSQRLTFDEGRVTMSGNMNPDLYFVARTEGQDIVVTVTVSGTVQDLKIDFASQPELPQDEVLAQLIFNRSIGELSAFQVAQLASAAAELAGVTNNSLLGALRANTGLDDLDVITDAQGNTGVRAGRYIRDNIYLGVEAGSGGNTKGTVNLDISKNTKAKGSLGAEGDSSVGVFYEKDY